MQNNTYRSIKHRTDDHIASYVDRVLKQCDIVDTIYTIVHRKCKKGRRCGPDCKYRPVCDCTCEDEYDWDSIDVENEEFADYFKVCYYDDNTFVRPKVTNAEWLICACIRAINDLERSTNMCGDISVGYDIDEQYVVDKMMSTFRARLVAIAKDSFANLTN